MSCYEGHRGKLIPTECTIKSLIESGKVTPPTYVDINNEEDLLEFGFELFYYTEEYVSVNGKIYKVKDSKYEDAEKTYAKVNPDNSIDYDVYYYNGGCGFEEALEQAVEEAESEALPELTPEYVYTKLAEVQKLLVPNATQADFEMASKDQTAVSMLLCYLLGMGHTVSQWDVFEGSSTEGELEQALEKVKATLPKSQSDS